MRPTGKLHLGHLMGALKNWAALQDTYDCSYFVADWHALTSDYAEPSQITSYALDNVADWIAAGVDPERSTIFIQSLVPEHAELFLLLSMVVPIPWLERVPTYKEQREQITDKDLSNVGFLAYPLLQTADVVIYDAKFVPVGEDQVPHLELSREVVRRFHQFYGSARRTATAADLHATAARARQPQDEQELRQHHRPYRRCGHGDEEGAADVHGSQADPRRHPGHGRRQSRLHVP
jgi:tryptophanyl-tRNA synthetase